MKKSFLLIFLVSAGLLACSQSNQNLANDYFDSGYVKYSQSDYMGALADYSKAIELDSNYAWAYFNRGVTKLNLGLLDGGCLDLSKAGELGIMEAYDVIKEYCN